MKNHALKKKRLLKFISFSPRSAVVYSVSNKIKKSRILIYFNTINRNRWIKINKKQ